MRIDRLGQGRLLAAALLGGLAVGLAGCGVVEFSSDGGDDDPTTTTAAPEPAPSSAPAAPPSESTAAQDGNEPASNADATAPGSELKVGEQAVIDFKSGNKSGTLGLTIDAIDKGDPKALTKALGSKGKGYTPYHVRHTVKNIGGTDLTSTGISGLYLVDGSGERLSGATVIGTISGCDNEPADANFKTPGATYKSCETLAVKDGATPGGVEYSTGEKYLSDPLVWKN